jgi:hypothetical protein
MKTHNPFYLLCILLQQCNRTTVKSQGTVAKRSRAVFPASIPNQDFGGRDVVNYQFITQHWLARAIARKANGIVDKSSALKSLSRESRRTFARNVYSLDARSSKARINACSPSRTPLRMHVAMDIAS